MEEIRKLLQRNAILIGKMEAMYGLATMMQDYRTASFCKEKIESLEDDAKTLMNVLSLMKEEGLN